jgi:hypothetical protein
LKRLASALATGALVLSPLALAPVASAAPADKAPARSITSNVVKVKGKLIMKGKVGGDYKRKEVIIQKAACNPNKCPWKTYRKIKTNRDAKYSQRIAAPAKGNWFWRAKVKASGGYATSYSGVWKTYRV